jgi:hypothetical protein
MFVGIARSLPYSGALGVYPSEAPFSASLLSVMMYYKNIRSIIGDSRSVFDNSK